MHPRHALVDMPCLICGHGRWMKGPLGTSAHMRGDRESADKEEGQEVPSGSSYGGIHQSSPRGGVSGDEIDSERS